MTSPSSSAERARVVDLHRSGATQVEIARRMRVSLIRVRDLCDQLRLYPLHGYAAQAAWSLTTHICYGLGVPDDQVQACRRPGLPVDESWTPNACQREALGKASDIAEGYAWYEQQQEAS